MNNAPLRSADSLALGPTTLLSIGELASKSDHIARIPYPDFAGAVDDRAVALCAAANTALAGMRLSRGLTDALRRSAAPDPIQWPTSRGDRAFTNLAAVLSDDVAGAADRPPPSVATVASMHRRLVEGLDEPTATPAAEQRADWARHLAAAFEPTEADEPTARMRDACERAIAIHLATVQLRPFASANNRVARLLEAMVFAHSGVPLRVSGLLACAYADDPRRYRTMLRSAASRGAGDNDTARFADYAIAGLVGALRDELEHVHQPMWMRQQARYVWREYVDAHFAGDASPDAARRRQLAADLPAAGVKRDTVRSLSAAVAAGYEGLDADVVENDLDALVARTLIVSDGLFVMPRLDRVPRWIAPF